MAKERSELDILRSICKLLDALTDALTPEAMELVWAYLVKRYRAQGK